MSTPAEALAAQFPATKEAKRDALAEAAELLPRDLVPMDSPMATILNPVLYKHLLTVAAQFAKSQLVPQHFRDKPADVFIALHMAHRMGCDPILVLQNLYTVHGTPGWKAQFIIAQANLARAFASPIRWRVDNHGEPLNCKRKAKNSRGEFYYVDVTVPNLTVTAYATDKETGEELSVPVTMQQAIDEGWTDNPKYSSLGELMLRYRSATFLVRLYAPQVMLGVPAVEELEDITIGPVHNAGPRADEPSQSLDAAALGAQLLGAQPAPAEPPTGPREQAQAQKPSEPAQTPTKAETAAPPAEKPRMPVNEECEEGGHDAAPSGDPESGDGTASPHTKAELLEMVAKAELIEQLDYVRTVNDEHMTGGDKAAVSRALNSRAELIRRRQSPGATQGGEALF